MVRVAFARVASVAFAALCPGAPAQTPVPPTQVIQSYDGTLHDDFGAAVALDGNVLVVGAPSGTGGGPGAAYVYERCGPTFSLSAKLTAADGQAGDGFGFAAAVSGDTIALAAPYADLGGTNNAGAVYLFEHQGGGWTLSAKLALPTPGLLLFGARLRLRGDLLAVAHPPALFNIGRVQVYRRSASAWSHEATLATNDPLGYSFGSALDHDGSDRIVVGAINAGAPPPFSFGPGAAYVFERQAGVWTQSASLIPAGLQDGDGFGHSVELQGDRLFVASPGQAVGAVPDAGRVHVFEDVQGVWGQVATVQDTVAQADARFGTALAADGGRLAVGNAAFDRFHVFQPTGGAWTAQQQLESSASPGLGGRLPGFALDGAMAVIGDLFSAVTKAWAYDLEALPGSCACQDPPAVAETGSLPGGPFGYGATPAVGGGHVFVGDNLESTGAIQSGAVYVFSGTPTTMALIATLKGPVAWPGLQLGVDVAAEPGRVIAGTRRDQVHVFEAGPGGAFAHTAILDDPSATLPLKGLGLAVALAGADRVVAGAEFSNDLGASSGAAFVFDQVAGTWNPPSKLLASDGAAGDLFGADVAAAGSRVVAGAPADDDMGVDSGSVYVFEHSGTWAQTAKLTAPDGKAGARFGEVVALQGNVLAVGVRRDATHGAESGAVYLFEHNGTAWAFRVKLLAPDPAPFDWYGHAIALDAGRLAILAARVDQPFVADTGEAYVYEKAGAAWVLTHRFASPGAFIGEWSGNVALEGDLLMVGTNVFDLRMRHFGCGCAGSAEQVPTLRVTGDPAPGGALDLAIEHGFGGMPGTLFLGMQPANLPAGAGCSLLVAPQPAVQVPILLGGSGPGAGSLTFTAAVPASLPPLVVVLQAWLGDPGAPLGYTATNAVEILLQ